MSKEPIDWNKKLEECNSAFDMLKLESEFLKSEEEPNLDNFYTDVWYGRIDKLLGREEQFLAIEDLKENVKELEKALREHDHKDGSVIIKY
ncbi:MAG: hypothetical protein NT030_06670 [Candidatus Saganbacteria bacterium]|nr:hypothetical protein [Candidatus Saganbacteria bacterium]